MSVRVRENPKRLFDLVRLLGETRLIRLNHQMQLVTSQIRFNLISQVCKLMIIIVTIFKKSGNI